MMEFRVLDNDEIDTFVSQWQQYSYWLKALETAQAFFGPTTHSVVIAFYPESDDEGGSNPYIESVTVRDVNGEELEVSQIPVDIIKASDWSDESDYSSVEAASDWYDDQRSKLFPFPIFEDSHWAHISCSFDNPPRLDHRKIYVRRYE